MAVASNPPCGLLLSLREIAVLCIGAEQIKNLRIAPPPRATALFRKTRANFKKCYNFLMKKGGFPLTGLL